MNPKHCWNLLTVLILAGLLTGVSCAKKQISADTGNTQAAYSGTSDASNPGRGTGEDPGIGSSELSDRLAREKAAEQAAARQEEAKKAFFDRHILFAFDSATLDDTAKALAHEKADWLRENKEVSVMVEGHCDMTGTTTYNLALGERRAMAVKNYLESLGVDAARIDWVSYGEERPISPGRDEASLRLNRRAQFRIQLNP